MGLLSVQNYIINFICEMLDVWFDDLGFEFWLLFGHAGV